MAIDTDALLAVMVAPGQPDETPRRTPEQLLPSGRTTVMSIAELSTLIGSGGGGFPLVALIQHQEAFANNAGTFTSGAPRTRLLNTVVHNDIGLTLGSSRFTLLAGTYLIYARCPAYRVHEHQAWLVEDPGGTPSVVLTGTAMAATADVTNGQNGPMLSVIEGVLVVSTDTEYEIQHQCDTTIVSNGLGILGLYEPTPAIYTSVLITQIA